jgi:hypothetical protein
MDSRDILLRRTVWTTHGRLRRPQVDAHLPRLPTERTRWRYAGFNARNTLISKAIKD